MRLVRLVVLLLVSTALFAWPIFADTVSIGFSTGGSPTAVATALGSADVAQPFGSFSNVHVAAQGQSTLIAPDILFSNTIDTTALAAGGTVNIFVTDQGLTSPTGTVPFFSSFTANTLPAGWTVTESTFVSSTNALFSGSPLGSATFSAIGTNSQTESGTTGAGPYSVTEEFSVTATSAGDDNLTIDLSATPVGVGEPSSLIGLAAGLIGLGFLRRWRIKLVR